MHAADGGHATARRLARERAAGVAVAARPERRSADEHVGPLLIEPAQELRERVFFVLTEVVVAAGERDGHVETEASAGADGAVEADRLRAGRLLATEAGEELVDVVHDLHHDTARSFMSPI